MQRIKCNITYHKISRKIDKNRDIYIGTFLSRKIEESQTKPSQIEKSVYIKLTTNNKY